MKIKTIGRLCREAMEEWIASLPTELQQPAMEDAFLTGGAIASLFLAERVNDWDIYFRTTTTAQAVAEHYVQRFKDCAPAGLKDDPKIHRIAVRVDGSRVTVHVQSAGVVSATSGESDYQYFEGDTAERPDLIDEYVNVVFDFQANRVEVESDYTPVLMSGNAITLGRADKRKAPLQMILRFTGEPAEVHKNFDWAHATNWFDLKHGLVTNTTALGCLLTRELIYQGTRYPLAALIRSYKFMDRGWQRPHAGHMLVLTQELAGLNWDDPHTWYDQLTGVDFAYFHEVIARIRKLLAEGVGMEEIVHSYLAQIVEEVM